MQIVTRFAPSPTGDLHIGGARTALFNWLFAQHYQGKFYLRIEDTDLQRSTNEAKEAILNGLKWLGISWDDDVIYQSEKKQRHQDIAHTLLQKGKAYYCYMTPEEIQNEREAAKKEGMIWKYDGRWRDNKQSIPSNIKPVIRLKAPLSGTTIISDLVQGTVTVENETLDDMILLRSDGSPTYMLSVVVDDHDMGITHVIRGDDHFTNSFRQKHIFDAMGWVVPEYAHIPLIHGQDGAKLSKRHGALNVEAYKDMGYLPEALLNYLLRLGWSFGNEEIISISEAIDNFSIKKVGKSPSKFDFDKLNYVNAHYLRQMPAQNILPHLVCFLEKEFSLTIDNSHRITLEKAIESLKPRCQNFVEMANNALFYVQSPPLLTEKSQKFLQSEGLHILKELYPNLQNLKNWTTKHIEDLLHNFCAEKTYKFGQIGQPLRACLSGTPNSPGLYDIMYALGQKETLKRINHYISPML